MLFTSIGNDCSIRKKMIAIHMYCNAVAVDRLIDSVYYHSLTRTSMLRLSTRA